MGKIDQTAKSIAFGYHVPAKVILLRQLLTNRGVTAETLSLMDWEARPTALAAADVVVISYLGLADRPAYVRHDEPAPAKSEPEEPNCPCAVARERLGVRQAPRRPRRGGITANNFNEVVEACVHPK